MTLDPQNALNNCDTLMLDMDGTLLDLAYDNFMWLEHIPGIYAERKQISKSDARDLLAAKFRSIEGKLNWYCLDHWSEVLDLDIAALHRDESERIGYLPGARKFLNTMAEHHVRVLLVSNSHQKTLDIKAEITGIPEFFDAIYLSHDLGHAKEDQPFWHSLQEVEGFDPETTVFIDDNPSVLQSARTYGIDRLLFVSRPDSRRPPRKSTEFSAIDGVAELLV